MSREPNDSRDTGDTPPQYEGPSHGQQRAPPNQAAANNQESVVDAIQRPGPQSFIQGIVAIMAVTGALLGLALFLVAQIGGRSLFPGLVQELSGAQGVNEALSFTHQITLAYMANELAIFLAFLMAPIFGTLVAFKLDDTRSAKMGAAGVGVALGTVVFTFIVVMVASIVAPTGSDLIAVSEAVEGGSGAPAGGESEMLEGADLGSINVVNTLLNSILAGIPAGLAAASVIYFNAAFFE